MGHPILVQPYESLIDRQTTRAHLNSLKETDPAFYAELTGTRFEEQHVLGSPNTTFAEDEAPVDISGGDTDDSDIPLNVVINSAFELDGEDDVDFPITISDSGTLSSAAQTEQLQVSDDGLPIQNTSLPVKTSRHRTQKKPMEPLRR
ncbi:unnamed protein product [Peniophora sp. CBMAI 1063]|nr:unnamed protein product [Peniophora sp. CBMAI 1063]